MKNPAVKYAVIAWVISIVWTLIQHVLGYNTTKHEIGQYTRMLGAFVFYFLLFIAIYQARKQQGGSLSFGEGFKTGAVMTVIYSAGISIWYALYGEVINTQYKTSLMAFERSKLEAANATPEMIADKMNVSFHTIHTHLRIIYEKLHVHSLGEAVALAHREKLF